MKMTALRCCDYMDWLKEQEEFLLFQIERCDMVSDFKGAMEFGEELQIVREIKDIVGKYEEKHDA